MKQIRATDLRKKKLMATSQKSQIHSAYHNCLVIERQKRNQVLQLQQKTQSEELKNALQTHKVVI